MNFDRSCRRTLWPTVIFLGLTLSLFEFAPKIDLSLQDRFFDSTTGKWLVDARDPLLRMLFYNVPKWLLLTLGTGIAVICFCPARLRHSIFATERLRKEWIVVLVTLISAPLSVSTLKAVTHVFCPYELKRYDGDQEYKTVFERYTWQDRPHNFGRGFPAGHASGGFALLSLAGVGATRRGRLIGFVIGTAAGSIMGGYQMLKGAHFLSHTIVTALICWSMFIFWHRAIVLSSEKRKIRQSRRRHAEPPNQAIIDWRRVEDA